MSSETPEFMGNLVARNVRGLLAYDEKTPGRGAAKLARRMGWSPHRCRELYYGRAAATMDEVAELAKAFGVSPEAMLEDPSQCERVSASARRGIERWEDEQCQAYGNELARALWETAGDESVRYLILNESFHVRSTHPFWTAEKLALAGRYALDILARALADRYPHRDCYPFRETLPLGSQIISDGVAPEPRGV